MKIEIKNIIHARSLSEETNAFTAKIYIDGKKVGYCENRGQGGNTNIHAEFSKSPKALQANCNILAKADEFCKTLPDNDFGLEGFINGVVQKDLNKKDIQKNLKSSLKAIDRDCIKNIVLISAKELKRLKTGEIARPAYKSFGWKIPITDVIQQLGKDKFNEQLTRIKTQIKGDEFIYNKNLPK